MHLSQNHNLSCASKGITVWLTGLSGAGKSTIAQGVFSELSARDKRVQVLDGDIFRKEINYDLSFSEEDRIENIRRIGFIADMLSRHGVIVLVAAISPFRSIRNEIREKIGNFIEVFVSAPLEICEQRDPKGLYQKARKGLISNFTGIDSPYEEPLDPDLLLDTNQESIQQSISRVLEILTR